MAYIIVFIIVAIMLPDNMYTPHIPLIISRIFYIFIMEGKE